MEHQATAEPVNLGSPEATSIETLVELVLRCCGHRSAALKFDTSRPDGPMRKLADPMRMREKLGLRDLIPLENGLAETVEWIRRHRRAA